MSYWVEFEDGSKGCVEFGIGTEIPKNLTEIAFRKKVKTIDNLPYPASPRLGPSKSSCPSFCYSPEECKGRSSCPKGRACSE